MPARSRFFAATALSVLLVIGGVTAAAAETARFKWNKSTGKDQTFVASENWDVHPDCRTRAVPVIKVIAPPKHGKVRTGRGKITLAAKFLRDPYYKCKSPVVTGNKLYYTPGAGFVGNDLVKIRVSYSTGDVHEITIAIKVK